MNRLSTLRMITITLLGTVLFASAARAQTAKDLIGAWTLVSDENVRADGSRVQVMGPNPQGFLIFNADGRYSLQLLRPGRPKFASNNRMEGTPEENKAAVQGANPHWGTYSVNEANKTIDFKIEHAFFPNWEGTEQKRPFTINGDELKYTATASTGGMAELVWRRAK
jgi:hypothetical protein